MKEFNDMMKVLAGAEEKDVEEAIEIYVMIYQAFLTSLLANKKIVAKFIIANRSIIISVAQFVMNIYAGITALIPQFDVLEKNLKELENEWDSKSFEKDGDDIEDAGIELCHKIGERLDIDHKVLVKATWIQNKDLDIIERKVMWIGYMPNGIFSGSEARQRDWLEDQVEGNLFEFGDLKIEMVSIKERNKKFKVAVKIGNNDWVESKMTGRLFTHFMEDHGQGEGSSYTTELKKFLLTINEKFNPFSDEVEIKLI